MKFLRRDPATMARHHVEKAIKKTEQQYYDYASEEYEKAARLFHEADQADFAIKYFREAAYSALQNNDHVRAGMMKIAAAEVLAEEGRFEEAGNLYAEASDHFFREKRLNESVRAMAMCVMSLLASKNFNTAVNQFKKGEKRFAGNKVTYTPSYELTRLCVNVLCEGLEVPEREFNSVLDRFRPSPTETALIDFVAESVRCALKTSLVLEWAGAPIKSVTVKTPIELELRYECPVPVRVIGHKYNLSSSIVLDRGPVLTTEASPAESWLLIVRPVLSGDGVIGPFSLTLEGERVLINKHSNTLRLEIEKAPARVDLTVTPPRLACSAGDEVVFDIVLTNSGDGAAESIGLEFLTSHGLEISVGVNKKTIQFLGVGESLRLQVFLRARERGEQVLMVHLLDVKGSILIEKKVVVRVD